MLTDMTTPPPAAYYAAWGTGTGVASDTDLGLFNEDLTTARQLMTLTPGGVTLDFYAVIVATSSETITNTGIFTAPTGGVMIWHTSFAPVMVGPGPGVLPSLVVDVSWALEDF